MTTRKQEHFSCPVHRDRLQRTCPKCQAETGFDEAAWAYYVAKRSGVVLPLALCCHGNVAQCPAGCTDYVSQKGAA